MEKKISSYLKEILERLDRIERELGKCKVSTKAEDFLDEIEKFKKNDSKQNLPWLFPHNTYRCPFCGQRIGMMQVHDCSSSGYRWTCSG